MAEKRALNTFIRSRDISFGDYLLFQEYQQSEHDGKQYSYKITKPILAIYLGFFMADQTIGFNYVKWINDSHTVKISNDYVTDFRVCKRVDGIHEHIEWSDYLDILEHWDHRPTWKEIIKPYRQMNKNEVILSNKIKWR